MLGLAAKAAQIGYRAYKGGKVLKRAKKAVQSAYRWLDSDVFTWTSKSGEVMKRTGTAVKTKTGKVAVRSPRGGQTFVGKGTKRRWSGQKAGATAATAISTGYALVPKVESEKEAKKYIQSSGPHNTSQTTSKQNLKSLKQAPWTYKARPGTNPPGAGAAAPSRKEMEDFELGRKVSTGGGPRGEAIAGKRKERVSAIRKRVLQRDLAKKGPGGYDVYKKGSSTAESFRKKHKKEKAAGKKTFTWNSRKYTTK